MRNGSPSKRSPSDLIRNCLQNLLALVITYSLWMTYVFCVKGQYKTIFGLVLKFVNFLSSGGASANGEQLLLILEWADTQKEAFCSVGTVYISL